MSLNPIWYRLICGAKVAGYDLNYRPSHLGNAKWTVMLTFRLLWGPPSWIVKKTFLWAMVTLFISLPWFKHKANESSIHVWPKRWGLGRIFCIYKLKSRGTINWKEKKKKKRGEKIYKFLSCNIYNYWIWLIDF